MAIIKVLCNLVQDPNDPSTILPAVQAAFPRLNLTAEYPDQNPDIPPGYALVTITNSDGNTERALLAMPYVSRWL